MKFFYTLLFITFSKFIAFSQTLTASVYSNITLASDHYESYFNPPCYQYWFSFEYNCFSYPSGMTLYLRIDSIASTTDSIKLWRSADMSGYRIVHPHDTIRAKPLITGSNEIYVYYLDSGTLYTSLIAAGIPDSAGQSYFCSYNSQQQLVVDACSNFLCSYYGGTGPFDTVQSCFVVASTALQVQQVNTQNIDIYPSPNDGNFRINGFNENTNYSIEVLNSMGQVIYQNFSDNLLNRQVDIDSRYDNGIYFLRINSNGMQKVIKFCINR